MAAEQREPVLGQSLVVRLSSYVNVFSVSVLELNLAQATTTRTYDTEPPHTEQFFTVNNLLYTHTRISTDRCNYLCTCTIRKFVSRHGTSSLVSDAGIKALLLYI